MPADSAPSQLPGPEDLRELGLTISGLPTANDRLATRLQFIAELMAEAGPVPKAPVLVWRDAANSVRHAIIGREFIVGRQNRLCNLAFTEDKALSRRHFVIRATEHGCVLEDLDSHNGTALIQSGFPLRRQLLHDGDLIYAGGQVFAFLSPPALAGASDET